MTKKTNKIVYGKPQNDSQVEQAWSDHNNIWEPKCSDDADRELLLLTQEHFERLNSKGLVRVVTNGTGGVKGSVLLHRMVVDTRYSRLPDIEEIKFWDRLRTGEEVGKPKEFNAIWMWAVNVPEPGQDLARHLIQGVLREFDKDSDQYCHLAGTFSPIDDSYGDFIERLLETGELSPEFIAEWGIYLYLAADRGGEFKHYLGRSDYEHWAQPEEWYHEHARRADQGNLKSLCRIQNVHGVRGGATIIHIWPSELRPGITRPASPCTVMYGYRGWVSRERNRFQQLNHLYRQDRERHERKKRKKKTT